jgi:hypothetical protein
VGPGRNIGNGLLWWTYNATRCKEDAVVLLWDVFPNATIEASSVWEHTAAELLGSKDSRGGGTVRSDPLIVELLKQIAAGQRKPDIQYRVESMPHLLQHCGQQTFDLILSHAVLEHVWRIGDCWRGLAQLTSANGWHSHRIDLADHGRREGNYVEMLQWSTPAYWASMRFVPGATNRWRASRHLAALSHDGFRILRENRLTRPSLPIARARLAREFRRLDELELRTVALDVVARKR